MIIYQTLLTLLTVFFTIINVIVFVRGSGNGEPDSFTGSGDLETLASSEILFVNKPTSSNSDRSGKRSQASSTLNTKNKKYKYRHNLPPVPANVNPDKIGSMKTLETKLASFTRIFKWDLRNVSTKMGTHLCNFAWLRLPTTINVTDKVSPACTPLKISNLSRPDGRDPLFRGYFSYLNEKEDPFFNADWLRCNCAYVASDYDNRKMTVRNSKGYFLLFTEDKLLYFVVTILPEFEPDNVVKIIDAIHIPPLQPEQ